MGLTNGHAAYASINESGFNKFIRNIAVARPHYFHFATAGLGGGAPAIGLLPPLTIPGTNYGLQYEITITPPKIDFFPPTLPLPSGMVLNSGQFAIATSVTVCVLCSESVRATTKGTPLTCAKVEIWAIGHPTRTPVNATDTLIGLAIDEIVLKDVGNLEAPAECVSKDTLNVLLFKARYLVQKHVFGAFAFFLADGPTIADDQIKVWGDIS